LGEPNYLAMEPPNIFAELDSEVIEGNLCTHCGTCVGLSNGLLEMCLTEKGPIPRAITGGLIDINEQAYAACPGRGLNFPELNEFVFGRQPENWLLGCYQNMYIGYSNSPEIRQRGASGGVITQALLYLLRKGTIDGAVVLRQGYPKPWMSVPIIAQTEAEIIAASQSVYAPTSMNLILKEMADFPGRLAYVGLPDQVASLRSLQRLGSPGALKVDYVLGLYMGTGIYIGAIESFLRMNGIRSLNEVAELHYRDGEWPGHLHIRTTSGRILQSKKFYYNYLIPFYITQASLLSVDFTNELADLSVGDAWHPRYETSGAGFSVIVSRTNKAEKLLHNMQQDGELIIEQVDPQTAMSMHGHMLDFKKRGAFIRIQWLKMLKRPTPDYGYKPAYIPASRKLVEIIISGIFLVCRTKLARRVLEFFPISMLGPIFDGLRRFWKGISKPAKRRGLSESVFVRTNILKEK
jgi:coenzyme F420 hydrogenase subunit beta